MNLIWVCAAEGDAVVATCAGDSEVRVHDVSRGSATDIYRCLSGPSTSSTEQLDSCVADGSLSSLFCMFLKQQALPI